MSNDRDAVVAQLRAAGLDVTATCLVGGMSASYLAEELEVSFRVRPDHRTAERVACVAALRALEAPPKQDAIRTLRYVAMDHGALLGRNPLCSEKTRLASLKVLDAAEDAVRREQPVRAEEPALREQVIAALDLLNRVRLRVGVEVSPPTDGLYGSGHAAVRTARRRAQRASTIEGLLHDGLNEVLLCDLARAIRAGVLVPEERS